MDRPPRRTAEESVKKSEEDFRRARGGQNPPNHLSDQLDPGGQPIDMVSVGPHLEDWDRGSNSSERMERGTELEDRSPG